MSSKLLVLKNLFYQGEYHSLREYFLSGTFNDKDPAEAAWICMGLARLGMNLEAVSLWKKVGRGYNKASRTDYARVLSYICMSYVRVGEYEKANLILKDLMKIAKGSDDHEILFYFFQTFSFVRYYQNRIKNCLRLVERAIREAYNTREDYVLYLAYDLYGHALVKSSKYAFGLENLKLALRFAKRSGSQRAINAESISIAVLESELGISYRGNIAKLRKSARYHCEDNYTYSKIYLQLAYQHILRGKFHAASQALEDARSFIESNENKPHLDRYNYLRIFLVYLQGNAAEAKVLIQKFFPVSGMDVIHSNLNHWLYETFCRQANIKVGDEHDHRIYRIFKACVEGKTSILDEIKQSKYFGFLKILFDFQDGVTSILTNLWQDQVLLWNRYEVYCKKTRLNPTQIGFIKLLENGSVSKSKFIEKIWGYQYRPERHDILIYPVISKIRKSLAQLQVKVLFCDEQYSFSSPVCLIDTGCAFTASVNTDVQTHYYSELNFRQVDLLRKINLEEWVDSKKYQNLFSVSRATATRDLVDLRQKGFLLSYGNARSIQYCLAH